MNIPTYDELLNPVLKLAKLKPITRRSAALEISELLKLTEEQKSAVIPSGNGTYFGGRVSWAMTFLTKAGLISKIEKATYKITPEGEAFLAKFPDKITVKDLETIEGWQEAWNSSKRYKQLSQEDSAVSSTSPDELIGTAMAVLNDALKVDLLELLKTVDPYFFEQIVIDVLVAMGYGGSRAEAARVTQKSNDGGIDGTEPRQHLWRALTPQLFRRFQLTRALQDAGKRGVEVTDESMAMELQGLRPLLIEGSEDNFKVTTPADLARFEFILSQRGR